MSAPTVCLLPNCCFLSETSRIIQIHRALVTRGASVHVATHGGTHQRALTDAGIAYEVLGPGWPPARCEAFVRSIPGIGPPDQSMWSDDEIRTYVAAETDFFRAHGAQAAVTGWTLTALLSTRVAGIPLVTEHAGAYLPPVFERGLLPAPSHPIGIPMERWLPQPVRRTMVNRGAERLSLHTDGFNRVADELGVEPIPSFPALLLGDLTLVTEAPEVLGIPQAELDAWVPRHPRRYRAGTRLHTTGPLYAELSLRVPDRVADVLSGPRPVVYVAITSSPAALVRDVVAALRPLGARILVAATVHDLGDLEDEQVTVGGVLPSHLIMPEVDLAVTAGGQGSVQTAMAGGVPLIGIPLQPEQDTNVALVARKGAARLVPEAAAGTTVLTDAARMLLADPSFREQAQRIRSIYAAIDGPARAADAILGLAGAARHVAA